MKFDDALDIILHHEGGYSDHPQDPGGATNMGITLKTLSDWRGKPVTKEDVIALPKSEAGEIYKARYWGRAHCDALPDGVDLIIFDAAVNQGPGKAAAFLQQAMGVTADGIIGPKTLAAVNAANPLHLVKEIAVRRACHYASLNPTFRLGWYRRLFAVYASALRQAA